MEIPYGHTEKITINQHAKPALTTQVDAHRAALMVLPETADGPAWKHLPYAGLLGLGAFIVGFFSRENSLTPPLPARSAKAQPGEGE